MMPVLAAGQLSPSPKHFRDSLLKALAKMSAFRAEVFLDAQAAIVATLQEAGYDPDHLPKGMSRFGRVPAGTDRNITLAYRYAHRDSDLTLPGKAGLWALSPAGLTEARRLLPVKPEVVAPPKKAQNLTSQWLDKHTRRQNGRDSELLRVLRSTIGMKLPVSAAASMVEDHVQAFLFTLIRRDGLRKKLESGQEVTYQHMAAYAVNHARNEIRNDGTEPVCRHFNGARTEYERKHDRAVDDRAPADVWRVVQKTEDDGTVSAEVIDPGLSMDTMDFGKVWRVVEQVVAKHHPDDGDQHLRVLRAMAEGYSYTEIAAKEGVPAARVVAMIAAGRDAMQKARRRLMDTTDTL